MVRGDDFDGGVIPLVRRRGVVVDVHEAVRGTGRGGGLHPIGVADLSIHNLMDENLAAYGSSGDGAIPVIADGEDPIAGNYAGKIDVRGAIGSAGAADHAGAGCIGESDDRERAVE